MNINTLDKINLDRAVVNIERLKTEMDRPKLSPHFMESALVRLNFSIQSLQLLHERLTYELETSRDSDAKRR